MSHLFRHGDSPDADMSALSVSRRGRAPPPPPTQKEGPGLEPKSYTPRAPMRSLMSESRSSQAQPSTGELKAKPLEPVLFQNRSTSASSHDLVDAPSISSPMIVPGAYHSTSKSSRSAKLLAIDAELTSLPSRRRYLGVQPTDITSAPPPRPIESTSRGTRISKNSTPAPLRDQAKTNPSKCSPGAHAVGGLSNHSEVAEEVKVETSDELDMPPIDAEVCQSENTIDAQAQDIENRIRSELFNKTAPAQVIPDAKISKRCMWIGVLSVLLLIVVVGVVVGAIVGTTNKNTPAPTTVPPTTPPAPTPPPTTSRPTLIPTIYIPPCTLCLDGSQPDLEAEVRRGVTCADLQSDLAQLDDAGDHICQAGQAQGWYSCSCPTLPSKQPSTPVCSAVCPVDSRPPAFNTQQCQDFETFVELAGLEPEDCADLIAKTPEECLCSDEIDQLRIVLNSISEEAELLDTTTPQYKAMVWLANEDPASLPIGATQGLELQMRYFGALLWFSLGGENWANQYGFMSADEVCNWNDGSNGILCSSFRGVITTVNIEQNSLIGTLPALELTAFDSLEVIVLSKNDVKGSIPSSINKLTALRILSMDENTLFTGSVPSSLFELNRLTRLWLDNCKFSGSLPSNIGEATSLTSLSLPGTGLTGSIPASISQLTSLVQLWLHRNFLSGTLPTVDKMISIELLGLNENLLGGTIPAHYGQLPKLENLFLFENQVEGTIPDFSGSNSLRNVYLQENRLDGNTNRVFTTTPTSTLEKVSLRGNQLTGEIPTSIGLYTRLGALWVYNNPAITGTLPTELGRLIRLGSFNVHGCQLTGALPSEMGEMSMLSLLGLNTNRFNSTIPLEFTNLQELQEVSFANNKLSGTVPSALSTLPNLELLLVQANDLTGSLDPFCNTGSEIVLRADCAVPAEITCECCETCL